MTTRRDIMILLERVKPEATAPDPQRRTRDLTRILSLPQPRGRRATAATLLPRRRRRGWRAAVAAAALAAVAAAAVLAPHSRQATGGVTNSSAPQSLPAREVLLAVAHKAIAQPVGGGRYWHTELRTFSTTSFEAGAGHAAFSLAVEGVTAMWMPARSGDPSWFAKLGPVFRFPTKADEDNWRRAGGPIKPDATSQDSKSGATAYVERHLDPGSLRRPLVPRALPGQRLHTIGKTALSVADIRALPTDPVALRNKLLSLELPERPELFDEASALFDEVGVLLSQAPVTPGTAAAAYRLLADLPGIRSLGTTTDPLGRTGLGVARVDGDPAGEGLVERQLIFDPDTTQLLAQQSILRKPGMSTSSIRPGTRLAFNATVKSGWVEQPPSVATRTSR